MDGWDRTDMGQRCICVIDVRVQEGGEFLSSSYLELSKNIYLFLPYAPLLFNKMALYLASCNSVRYYLFIAFQKMSLLLLGPKNV